MTAQDQGRAIAISTLVVFTVMLSLVGCSRKPPPHAPAQVYPKEAAELEPVELSELIYEAMPAKSSDGFSWSTLMGGSVRWMTDGIDSDPGGHSLRRGLARVGVSGAIVQVLKRAWTEQAWTVRLVGDSNENLGPSRVLVTPSEDYVCEYASCERCAFKASDAFRSAKLHVHSVCSGQEADPGAPYEVFAVEAAGKRTIYAELVTVGLANYGGSWLQLTEENPGCPLNPDEQEDVDRPAGPSQQNVVTPTPESFPTSDANAATSSDQTTNDQESQ